MRQDKFQMGLEPGPHLGINKYNDDDVIIIIIANAAAMAISGIVVIGVEALN